MGCVHISISYLSMSHIIRLIFFLLILSSTHLRIKVEGRANPKAPSISQEFRNEEKFAVRGRIGSRPPRCEKRCSSCAHCEAVQVPTNPQKNFNFSTTSSSSSSSSSSIAYSRGDDSNYKPMSWKCKCGNLIFNP